MGVKVYQAHSADDYISFIRMNSGIKFLSLNQSPQGLLLTYLEDFAHLRRRKECLTGYYSQEDLNKMMNTDMPQLKQYFSSIEMTVIAVGTSVIFKFIVTPIEGSNWEQFANDIGLTLV
jgi:hypothetical protein